MTESGYAGSISQELAGLEPGRIPLDVFGQIARLTVTPVVEVVPFYNSGKVTKVYLLKRASNDPLWADLYHVPGGIILPTDNP